MTQFIPLHTNVLIRKIETENKTKGGIIIPDNAKEKPIEGIVVAVGKGAKDKNGNDIQMTVKTGDVVVFGKWAGTEVKLNGEEFIVMKESDILGISGKKEVANVG